MYNLPSLTSTASPAPQSSVEGKKEPHVMRAEFGELAAELIILIVSFLMPRDLEALSLVNRKFRGLASTVKWQSIVNLFKYGIFERNDFYLPDNIQGQLRFGFIRDGKIVFHSENCLNEINLNENKTMPHDYGQFVGLGDNGFYALRHQGYFSNKKQVVCLRQDGSLERFLEAITLPSYEMYQFPLGDDSFLFISKKGGEMFCANFSNGITRHFEPLRVNNFFTRLNAVIGQDSNTSITVMQASYHDKWLVVAFHFQDNNHFDFSSGENVPMQSDRLWVMRSEKPGVEPFKRLKEFPYCRNIISSFFEETGCLIVMVEEDARYINECFSINDGEELRVRWDYDAGRKLCSAHLDAGIVQLDGRDYFPFLLYDTVSEKGSFILLDVEYGTTKLFLPIPPEQCQYPFQKICGPFLICADQDNLNLYNFKAGTHIVQAARPFFTLLDIEFHKGEFYFLSVKESEEAQKKTYSIIKLVEPKGSVAKKNERVTDLRVDSGELEDSRNDDLRPRLDCRVAWQIALFISAGGFFALFGCTIYFGIMHRTAPAVISGIGMGAPVPVALLSASQAFKKRRPFLLVD